MVKIPKVTRRKAIYLGGTTLATTLLTGWLRHPKSLKAYAARKGLLYGSAAAYSKLSENQEFARRFIEECAILTPENDLKWHKIHPKPNDYDFSRGDWLAEFAKRHKLKMRGHTLVWHQSIPKWLKETANPQNAESILKEHIMTVAGHYQGLIHSWDVVNEAIEVRDGHPLGLRKSPWFQWLGKDYIDIAFRVAAEADPHALLFYNDYDLDYDIPHQNAKREAVLNLLRSLKEQGTPIHGLGIQAHLSGPETRFNAEKLKQFLADVASLDLKIMVTEMDVYDRGLPYDYEKRDRRIAEVYEMYLNTVLEEPNVIGVLTWGLSDRYTWLSKHRPRNDKAPVRPLPLDREFKPKLAWESIANSFASST
ncbi:endo-1,4-beta-xylanase [Crocosphaera chwakensis]|uniref:Beta-xylanase n=1 Tax=Crocosphaera chwakensis CCY0110 TaxID=391612 RepID=A3IKY8_9CHRO|nr:endo-1,4-beta-xylanase [Crocosphaera chwakensis]EAZ92857.1 glycosyl hydrolase, family 10 [Crocosphaera chwakensis CCY0110]